MAYAAIAVATNYMTPPPHKLLPALSDLQWVIVYRLCYMLEVGDETWVNLL